MEELQEKKLGDEEEDMQSTVDSGSSAGGDGDTRDLENGPIATPERDVANDGEEKRSPDEGKRAFIAAFTPGDPENPKNWSPGYKALLTAIMGSLAFAGSSGTSIIVPAEQVLERYLHVGHETTVLLLSLYVLGKMLTPSLVLLFISDIDQVSH